MNTANHLKKFIPYWICLFLFHFMIATSSFAIEPDSLPAFPGAEGYGAFTPGGRGGQVIFVTNLNDSGPGSLRAACRAKGPRIVIFLVSGLITLDRPIEIYEPYLTLAGQTAPGDGICLRGAPLAVGTHDVVVRYIRSRLGDLKKHNWDCLTLARGAKNVIFDHCSATWSIDEAFSLAGKVSDATIQWCLIGEALNDSKHTKGPHGYGSLSRANGKVTFHHNLWAHNNSRNPRLGDDYGRPPYPTFDVRNNIMYDYGQTCSGLTQGVLKINYVGNYIKPGPSSKAKTPITVGNNSKLQYFIEGNIFEGNERLTNDNTLFFNPPGDDNKRVIQIVPDPFEGPIVTTLPAKDAYEAVLATVGASLPVRDSVDTRIVDHVRYGTGRIINSQNEVGGWPVYRSAEPPLDSDNDGIPDSWETTHGLNPQNPDDSGTDMNHDGYTNIEEYLNDLAFHAAQKVGAGVKKKN